MTADIVVLSVFASGCADVMATISYCQVFRNMIVSEMFTKADRDDGG